MRCVCLAQVKQSSKRYHGDELWQMRSSRRHKDLLAFFAGLCDSGRTSPSLRGRLIKPVPFVKLIIGVDLDFGHRLELRFIERRYLGFKRVEFLEMLRPATSPQFGESIFVLGFRGHCYLVNLIINYDDSRCAH